MKCYKNKASVLLTCGILILTLFAFSNCSNTGKGVKEDYKENKEEVGEEMEDAGEEMQDDDGN